MRAAVAFAFGFVAVAVVRLRGARGTAALAADARRARCGEIPQHAGVGSLLGLLLRGLFGHEMNDCRRSCAPGGYSDAERALSRVDFTKYSA